MPGKLTQVEAAKIMSAGWKWRDAATAHETAFLRGTPTKRNQTAAAENKAQQAFADLIATLTESEGL